MNYCSNHLYSCGYTLHSCKWHYITCFSLAGIVFNYCSGQICVWLVNHAIFLFWAVNFPFRYRSFRISGKIRYAHVISVLLALTLPLPGALVHLKDGYFAARNPTIICTGRNTDYTYYVFVLPVSVILGITSYLLIVSGWKIVKVS